MESMKFTRKFEAIQWFKIGDHPNVYPLNEPENLTIADGKTCGILQYSCQRSQLVLPGYWLVYYNFEDEWYVFSDKKFNELFREGL